MDKQEEVIARAVDRQSERDKGSLDPCIGWSHKGLFKTGVAAGYDAGYEQGVADERARLEARLEAVRDDACHLCGDGLCVCAGAAIAKISEVAKENE